MVPRSPRHRAALRLLLLVAPLVACDGDGGTSKGADAPSPATPSAPATAAAPATPAASKPTPPSAPPEATPTPPAEATADGKAAPSPATPAVPPKWWCTCYRDKEGADVTACRDAPADCQALRARARKGTRSIVAGSVSRGCVGVGGDHPGETLGGRDAWKPSARPGAWVSRGACHLPDTSPVGPAPLAAGLYYHQIGFYLRDTCRMCTRPRFAVTRGIWEKVEGAQASLRAAEGDRHHVGYPWVVHADFLPLEDKTKRGFAVVGGLFKDRATAEAWLAATPERTAHYTIEAIAGAEEFEKRLEALDYGLTVTQVRASAPAPAYDPDGIPFEIDFTQSDDRERRHAKNMDTLFAKKEPLCELAPGTLIAGSEVDFSDQFERNFIPVQCGDKPAVIRRDHTRVDTTVRPGPKGEGHRLIQVVRVECDTPVFFEWNFDGTERTPLAKGERRLAKDQRC